MARMPALLTIDEALERVLERVVPLEAEDVPVERAAGRVLAEAARATVDLPPFASSAMDGFAVRSADTPGTMRVVARAAAGRPGARGGRSRPRGGRRPPAGGDRGGRWGPRGPSWGDGGSHSARARSTR